MYKIIRAPLITEKMTILSERIRSASRSPPTRPSRRSRPRSRRCSTSRSLSVNTLIQKGKTKRFKGRPGVRSDLKKAIVTLAPGQSIDFTTGLA